jgi:hypothetical protein
MLPRSNRFDREPQTFGFVIIYYAEANKDLRLIGTVKTRASFVGRRE